MLSDLRNLPEMFANIKFEVGKPILPFQQLMSCLPPASSMLLPLPFRYLMTSRDSPIVDFYPVNFDVDMNGKKNPWEGVNLLPFIEINRLLDAIEKHVPDSKLTPAEKHRNRVGEIFFYTHDLTATETIEAPHKGIGLTDIVKCHSRCTIMPEYDSYGVSFKPALIPGTQIPYPGYPSLNVLPIADAELVPIGVKVFGFPSKYPTMVLRLHKMPEMPAVETLADNLLNRSLFINWPMMHEAKVTAVSDAKTEVRLIKGEKRVKKWNKMEEDRWATESEEIMQGYVGGINIPGSGGVEIGEVKIRLRLLPLQGMKTNPTNGSTKKLFGREEAEVPLQLALWQAPAPDPRFIERGPMTLQDRFPMECNVVLTKGKYRGCVGQVVGIADDKKVGVKVLTMPPEVPFGIAVARAVYESYISSGDASRILKINPLVFGRITSSLIFAQGGYDLGLNLKSQEGLCVAGYTRQKKETTSDGKGKGVTDEKKAWDTGDSLIVIGSARTVGDTTETYGERIQWEYTPKAIRLVNEYRQKFPQLFNALTKLPNERKYDANQVFGPNGVEWLAVIREWLNNVESAKLPRTPISTDTMSHEAVVAVEKAADVRNLAVKKKGFPQESLIKIPGSALYRENSTGATDVMLASDHNDNEAPELGDRIVNLCATGIPFGARGTVVGIHKATTGCVEVVMDEEFVGGTNLQGLCSNFRGKLAVWAHVMRITVENNQGVVDKLAPQGAARANVKKILSDIEKQVKDDNKTGNAAAVSLPASKKSLVKPAATIPTPNRHGSTSRNRATSAGKPRAESAGRGRQAGWREARGPPEKGTGFKERKGKSGMNRWKAHVSGKEKKAAAPVANAPPPASGAQHNKAKATELKAMLGVAPSPASNLKAMLGINSNASPLAAPVMMNIPPPPPQPNGDAAAGLKAMLGVGSRANAPAPLPSQDSNFPPPPPPPPPSAADTLMQLMSRQQQQYAPQSMLPPQPAISAFNFQYTEEGKEAPEPPKVPMMPPPMMGMGYPPPPPHPVMVPYGYMQQPPMPPMPGYPGMPPIPMGMPPIPMGMPPPLQHAMNGSPRGATNGSGMAVVSDDEFPPLGGGPPPRKRNEASQPPPAEVLKAAEMPAPPPPKPAPANLLVPTVVKKK
jgi:5'-3' exoribonuclease 1